MNYKLGLGHVILLFTILGASLFFFWDELLFWFFGGDHSKRIELVNQIGKMFAAIFVAIGLYLTYRRAKALERSVDRQTDAIEIQTDALRLQSKSIEIQAEQIEISWSTQTNEQFKNAVEHLGSEKEAIVIGGIHELYDIANNDQDFRNKIHRILCSFFRIEASKNGLQRNVVLQLIIDIVFSGSLHEKGEVLFEEYESDLRECQIRNLDFSDCYKIENANFSECIFEKVTFSQLEIENCNFRNTSWKNCEFEHCSLELMVSFQNSQFVECIFSSIREAFNPIDCTFLNCSFNLAHFVYGSDSTFIQCLINQAFGSLNQARFFACRLKEIPEKFKSNEYEYCLIHFKTKLSEEDLMTYCVFSDYIQTVFLEWNIKYFFDELSEKSSNKDDLEPSEFFDKYNDLIQNNNWFNEYLIET